jgi:nucleoside-diphosphate-sugar epimerase
MKIFITGATGYIGRPLATKLTSAGHHITALVRSREKAKDLNAQGIDLVEGDVNDVESAMPPDTEAVIHLAFSLFPKSCRKTNVDGSLKVIDAAVHRNVRRFIYTSSSLVYGPTPAAIEVTESTSLNPHMEFSQQQVFVERRLFQLARERNFPSVILRPSEVFGGRGGFFEYMVEMLKAGTLPVAGDGKQNIAFTELDDLHKAIMDCLTAELQPAEIMNIGTPMGLAVGDLYDRIASHFGARRPRRVPISVLLVGGALAGFSFKVLRRTPPFNLDIAKLSCMESGPRSIRKAKTLIGFNPTHPNPMDAIEKYYLTRKGT